MNSLSLVPITQSHQFVACFKGPMYLLNLTYFRHFGTILAHILGFFLFLFLLIILFPFFPCHANFNNLQWRALFLHLIKLKFPTPSSSSDTQMDCQLGHSCTARPKSCERLWPFSPPWLGEGVEGKASMKEDRKMERKFKERRGKVKKDKITR